MTYKESSNFGSGIHITGHTTVYANGYDTPYSFDIFQYSYDEVVLSLRNRLYQPDVASSLWKNILGSEGPRAIRRQEYCIASSRDSLRISLRALVLPRLIH